jgi:hypothetical protein
LKFLLRRRRRNAVLNIEGDNFEEEWWIYPLCTPQTTWQAGMVLGHL